MKMDLKIQFKTVSSQKKKQLEEESVQLYTGSNTGIASPIVGLKAYKIIEDDLRCWPLELELLNPYPKR